MALHSSFSQYFPLKKCKHLWILKALASAFIISGNSQKKVSEEKNSNLLIILSYKIHDIKDYGIREKFKYSVNEFVK